MNTLTKREGFPIYRKHKHVLMIVRFDGPTTGEIVMSSNFKEIGRVRDNWPRFYDIEYWRKCPTVEHDGVMYFDTQPVLIAKSLTSWCTHFVDATKKEKYVFTADRWTAFKVDSLAPIRISEEEMFLHWAYLSAHYEHISDSPERGCIRGQGPRRFVV